MCANMHIPPNVSTHIMRLLLTICLLLSLQICNAQNDFYLTLASAALELTKQNVRYDPQYFSISYPNGDVPSDKGVCTDVIIRAYRKLGIDLQEEVHEDMKINFSAYPNNWGLSHTDTNIDHRRVPNLMTFFSRIGNTLPITNKPDVSGNLQCTKNGK